MKGVSIAINVMVILVIALIVLISIIILFSDVWFSGVSSLTLEGVKNSACERLISTGCGPPSSIVIDNFDADKNGIKNSNDDLQDLCNNYYQCTSVSCCKQLCGC